MKKFRRKSSDNSARGNIISHYRSDGNYCSFSNINFATAIQRKDRESCSASADAITNPSRVLITCLLYANSSQKAAIQRKDRIMNLSYNILTIRSL